MHIYSCSIGEWYRINCIHSSYAVAGPTQLLVGGAFFFVFLYIAPVKLIKLVYKRV